MLLATLANSVASIYNNVESNIASMKWIYCIILVTTLCSCRSGKYVPIETVRTDSIYINQVQRDSIYQHDSIYIREKGDTVWMEKYKYIYRDKIVRDTMYFNQTDTIREPYPVEKELSRWQQIKLELGGWAFGIIIAAALIIIGWLLYKSRKK
jgi:hypothetical protein